MSEVKFNLVDAQSILAGPIHGSVVDRCVAALSAEPETIVELEAALARYMKPQAEQGQFETFRPRSAIDPEPWDAGLVIIDLAARIVATESTYSDPQPEGKVQYHDGNCSTDVPVFYRLPADWLFVNSVDAYHWSRERRSHERAERTGFDARAVLYGSPLLEFIVKSSPGRIEQISELNYEVLRKALTQEIASIHSTWLMTPRDDLRGRSPREVLLEKQDLIDFDLHTRSLQWTIQGEGPPCLAPDSFAYRFGGFGTHEWVVYYNLVRHLLWCAAALDCNSVETALSNLAQAKSEWLETGDGEYDGRVPAIIIDNERKRLPQAMSAKEIIIDDDCELCRMAALDAEMGFGPTFWHLDGSHMEEEFAFSSYLTIEEWETENRQREEFHREYERESKERQQRIALGETVDEREMSDPF